MKLIFEAETELGRCDAERINGHFGDDPGEWVAFAHTTAAQTGSQGMLRIEQRCFLRSSNRLDDVRTQTWVRPEMAFEPAADSKEQTMRMLHASHQSFVDKSRKAFEEQAVFEVRGGCCGL